MRSNTIEDYERAFNRGVIDAQTGKNVPEWAAINRALLSNGISTSNQMVAAYKNKEGWLSHLAQRKSR